MLRRSWKARARWVSALCGLLLASPAVVRGADGEENAARALFDAGVESYQRGQYDAAIAAFKQAYRVTERQGLLFSIAQAFRRSYEKDREPEKLREALRYYARYLSTNPEGERAAEAASWLEQLGRLPDAKGWQAPPATSQQRSRLVLAVNVRTARLTLDGQPVLTLPHATDVTAGKHHIAVTAEGYLPYQTDVDVAPGAVLPINIELRPFTGSIQVLGNHGAEVLIDGVNRGRLPAPGFEVGAGSHSVEVREPGHFTLRQTVELDGTQPERVRLVAPVTLRRTASWAAIGGGVAATATGGALGYLALQKQEDARALQDQPGMLPAFEDAVAARDGLRLAAAIVAGTGIAAVVAGTISLVTEGFGPVRAVGDASPGVSLPGRVTWSGTGLRGAF